MQAIPANSFPMGIAFCEEHPTAKGIVVSQDKNPRQLTVNDQLTLSVLPWRVFLEKLWKDEIIINLN